MISYSPPAPAGDGVCARDCGESQFPPVGFFRGDDLRLAAAPPGPVTVPLKVLETPGRTWRARCGARKKTDNHVLHTMQAHMQFSYVLFFEKASADVAASPYSCRCDLSVLVCH